MGKNLDGRSSDYVDRINRAIDFVVQNLNQPLNLEAVAAVACFSPFHFHRIFQAQLGESLQVFVNRLRLERAVALLSQSVAERHRRPNLTDIAIDCGFASTSDFSRVFKKHFGVAPSRFDVDEFRSDKRDVWVASITDKENRHLLDGLQPGENPDGFEPRVRRLAARSVVYTRVHDAYSPEAVPNAAAEMVSWAESRGVAGQPWLGYSWDNPEIVAPSDCRYDIGLEVPQEFPADKAVSRIEFPEFHVAELELRGGIDLEMRALDWLYKSWLPTSGFVPDDQPSFEAWIGHPFAHGLDYFELFVQLPIRRA